MPFYHAMVRPDKTDPAPDPRLWDTLVRLASVKPIPVAAAARAGTARLTSHDVERVFHDNMDQLNALAPAAAGMVKALLMELERRRTCRLSQCIDRIKHTKLDFARIAGPNSVDFWQRLAVCAQARN